MNKLVFLALFFVSLNAAANSVYGDFSLNCVDRCVFPVVRDSKSLPVRTFDAGIKIENQSLQLTFSSMTLMTRFDWNFEIDAQDQILENGNVIGHLWGLEFEFQGQTLKCKNQYNRSQDFYELSCSWNYGNDQWLPIEGVLAM